MSEPLRVIDMFAGIGGFSLGLHRTDGFETIAVAETDPYASKVLAKHFPDAPNVGDVTVAEYPHADIICAGFPCQDISFAGAGAGLAGSRSGLWREVVRAIRLVRPRYAIMENVAALLSRGMGTVLGDLAEVGHDAEWDCIPASYVGAWHRRDRVWILANANDERFQGGCPQAILRQSGLSRQLTGGFARWPRRSSLPKSRLCRGNDGVSSRMDRLRCLGNAVVPQIPELIGRAILSAIAGEARSGETVEQGSTGTASTRAERHRTTSGHLLHKRSD